MNGFLPIAAIGLSGALIAIISVFATLRLSNRRADQHNVAPVAPAVDVPLCEIELSQNVIRYAPRAIMDAIEDAEGDQSWDDLLWIFGWRFPGMPVSLSDLANGEMLILSEIDGGSARLELEKTGDMTQMRLRDPVPAAPQDRHLFEHHRRRAWFLAFAVGHVQTPMWSTDKVGRISWANPAYRSIEKLAGGKRADRRSVIEPTQDPDARKPPGRRRTKLTTPAKSADHELWFDVADAKSDKFNLFHATDVSAVVRAEKAQRNFVQTLTKTFAQLSIGLAIFDRDRRLVLFNPAMIDLTSLSPEFLSCRPTFREFFDELRALHIMPEPRDYKSWRERMTELDAAAEDGRYMETWSLPSGQTYRITGRPHPDGAIAFLFEDISAEITLNRRFRQQLDLAQSVIDSLEDGLALFSSQGTLSYVNGAYKTLWSLSEDAPQLDMSISQATALWQGHCKPSPIWADVRDFVVAFGERAEWDAQVRLTDGDTLDCRFTPLQGGATLVAFRRVIGPPPKATRKSPPKTAQKSGPKSTSKPAKDSPQKTDD